MAAQAVRPVQCVVCLEDTNSPIPIINGEYICLEDFDNGLRPQFEQALRTETAYPLKWGGTVLDFQKFSHLFPLSFVQQWNIKEWEYQMPVKERLYCGTISYVISDDSVEVVQERCGTFLGAKSTGKDLILCPKGHTVCIACAEPVRHLAEHECKPAAEENAFEGLPQGEVWQICPNGACGMKYQIWDGCNAMVCTSCRTPFCFVCGRELLPERPGHFAPGMPCPRFGKKGDARAIHDRPGMLELEALPPLPDLEDMEPMRAMFAAATADAQTEATLAQAEAALAQARAFLDHHEHLPADVPPQEQNTADQVDARQLANQEEHGAANVARFTEERNRIAESPQGQLEAQARRHLTEWHRRILREPGTEVINRLHALAHALETQLSIFTWGQSPMQRGNFQDQPWARRTQREIEDLMELIGEEGFINGDWEGLAVIAITIIRMWRDTEQ